MIHKTQYPNLDIIPSGPIPPNPGELSSSDKTRDMFDSLREEYDFIVVDSAPIGVVSDTYSVATIADAALVMVRFGTTKKNILGAVLSEVQGNGIEGLSLLVNDVKLKGTNYRYAYKYKYQEK